MSKQHTKGTINKKQNAPNCEVTDLRADHLKFNFEICSLWFPCLSDQTSEGREVQRQEPHSSKWTLSLSVPYSLYSFSGLDSLSHL